MYPKSLPYLLLLVLLGLSPLVQADEPPAALLACVSDEPSPPYTYPDREGLVQVLLRQALQAVGQEVRFVYEPRRRCVENVRQGRYQILPVAAYTPSLVLEFAFPMRQGKPDSARAMAETKALIVASKQTKVQWDGSKLSGLQHPILMNAGRLYLQDWARQRGLAFLEVRTAHQALDMLSLNRADIAILRDEELAELIHQGVSTSHLMVHPIPVERTSIYTVFDKEFAQNHPALVEDFWNTVAKIRATPEWKKRVAAFQ